MEEYELDARGLICPLPVLKARKLMQKLKAGDRLTILATDPGSRQDFAAFCDQQGHNLLESNIRDKVLSYVIEKA